MGSGAPPFPRPRRDGAGGGPGLGGALLALAMVPSALGTRLGVTSIRAEGKVKQALLLSVCREPLNTYQSLQNQVTLQSECNCRSSSAELY